MSLLTMDKSAHPASSLQTVKNLPGKEIGNKWIEVEVQLNDLDEGEKRFNIDMYFESPNKQTKPIVPTWHVVSELGQDSGNSKTNSTVKCPYCPELFKVQNGLIGSHKLRQHMKSNHEDMAGFGEFKDIMSELVKCEHCDKTYISQTLKVHANRVHGKMGLLETCHICRKTFTKGSSGLWGHIRTHREASFPCDLCGKKFKEGRDLRRHVMCHDPSNKSYKCDVCGNMFFQFHTMKQHKDFVHKKNLLFKCNDCGRNFATNTYLKTHIRSVHNKVKPYPCEVCGFRSSRVDNLNFHRSKVHHLEEKVTRLSIKQSVTEGSHPFCSKPEEIPNF